MSYAIENIKNNLLTPTEYHAEGKLLETVFYASVGSLILSNTLFSFHFRNIMSGVGYGFGLPSFYKKDKDGVKFKKAVEFKKNVAFFSGAKTFQQSLELSKAVFDELGNKRTFKEFKEIAIGINSDYNKNWLRTEQNTAFSLSQSAEKWLQIEEEKELLPYLQYITIGDERVRDDHKAWNGIIRKVDDKFWDTRFPPNDWNCRCRVKQLRDAEITQLKGIPQNDSKVFKNNPGKTGVIYPKTHPYFSFPEDVKKIASVNFGFKNVSDRSIIRQMKKTKK